MKKLSLQKIFILNAGESFLHAQGKFNQEVTDTTIRHFTESDHNTVIHVTNINTGYHILEEVEKYKWADLIIYHTPIWWFNIPHGFKRYFDEVFSAGRLYGLSSGDGRSSANPAVNYGTGGLLNQKPYIVTTSMNAPKDAFTIPEDFFNERTVDDGILFGFHRMHAYIGMKPLKSFHFYDIIKNADTNKYLKQYRFHLEDINK